MKVVQVGGEGFDSNIYLLLVEHPVLIDTGTGMFIKDTLARISRHIPPSDIERIILTHRHFDHVGGLRHLRAPAYIHPIDAEAVRSGDPVATGAIFWGEELLRMTVRELHEGEVIHCGVDLRVIHTPGHTPGGICLYEPETKSLFSGDTVFADGVGRWDMGGDKGALMASLRRLRGLTIKNLYPGHGRWIEGTGVKMP